MKVYF